MPARSPEELRGIAAEFAIGIANPDDAQYLQHLIDGNHPFAQAELHAFQETTARLALSANPDKPCGGLRAKLLRKIAEPAAPNPRVLPGFVEEVPGFHTLRDGAGKWRATGFPGIEMKLLSRDPASDMITTLIRMAPGTTLPRHQHAKEEQCWIVEGDVRQKDGSIHMKGGDFFRAMPGTHHDHVVTDNGCTLLIVGSAHDEYFD
jgi:quercetin dioxygenase-like cupin family protein